jgi:hypothetical protein
VGLKPARLAAKADYLISSRSVGAGLCRLLVGIIDCW